MGLVPATTKTFGRIDSLPVDAATTATFSDAINAWAGLGVTGVLLSPFDYAGTTTRTVQNAAIAMAKAEGLAVAVASDDPNDALSADFDATYNPGADESDLEPFEDLFFYTDYQFLGGAGYVDLVDWAAKAEALIGLALVNGIDIVSATSPAAFSASDFDWVAFSAVVDGHAAVGWTEDNPAVYSSTRALPATITDSGFYSTASDQDDRTAASLVRLTTAGLLTLDTAAKTGAFADSLAEGFAFEAGVTIGELAAEDISVTVLIESGSDGNNDDVEITPCQVVTIPQGTRGPVGFTIDMEDDDVVESTETMTIRLVSVATCPTTGTCEVCFFFWGGGTCSVVTREGCHILHG